MTNYKNVVTWYLKIGVIILLVVAVWLYFHTQKQVLVINYFRLSSASSLNSPILEWSASESFHTCTIFKEIPGPENTLVEKKTYDVETLGTLSVESGYIYLLGCGGPDLSTWVSSPDYRVDLTQK